MVTKTLETFCYVNGIKLAFTLGLYVGKKWTLSTVNCFKCSLSFIYINVNHAINCG